MLRRPAVLLIRSASLAALLCLAGAENARASDYERIAQDISEAAARHLKKRIAVLPFQCVGGEEPSAGIIIAEKLIPNIVSRGKLEVLERTLLKSVLSELRLQHSGATRPEQVQRLGKMLGVDAVVTGTFLKLKDGRLEINARMIDPESARILSVSSARVKRDWPESAFTQWDMGPGLLPGGGADMLLASDWRDGPNEGSEPCARAEREADALERSVVDLKAKYWAWRMRQRSFSPRALSKNPGSEIRESAVRERFYSQLRQWYDDPAVPVLSDEELDVLAKGEASVENLRDSCRTIASR